jgi:hypothetical protein
MKIWNIGGMIIGRGKPKYSDNNLLHYNLYTNSSQINFPTIGLKTTAVRKRLLTA